MAKAKGGTGRGTGKKGWTRWQKAELKKQKPLRISKAIKEAKERLQKGAAAVRKQLLRKTRVNTANREGSAPEELAFSYYYPNHCLSSRSPRLYRTL